MNRLDCRWPLVDRVIAFGAYLGIVVYVVLRVTGAYQ